MEFLIFVQEGSCRKYVNLAFQQELLIFVCSLSYHSAIVKPNFQLLFHIAENYVRGRVTGGVECSLQKKSHDWKYHG